MPVPGPPVITERRWRSAASTPASCSSVRVSPVAGPTWRASRSRSDGDSAEQLRQALGQLLLQFSGQATVDPGTLPDQFAGPNQPVQSPGGHIDVEQFGELGHECRRGQTRAAPPLGLGEQMESAGPGPFRILGRTSQPTGDPVGDGESDAEHARELIGPVTDHPRGSVAIGLHEPAG